MSGELEVLVPILPPLPAAPVARAPSPAGPVERVLLLGNGKPRAADLLDLVVDAVGASLAGAEPVRVGKPTAAKPLDDHEVDDLAGRVDLALVALGDCGACSACSVDDAVALERRGVPTVVVITEPFQGLAAGFASSAGLPDLAVAVVPHPVASRDDATVRDYAARVATVVTTRMRIQ